MTWMLDFDELEAVLSEAVFLLSAEGEVLAANRQVQRVLGIAPERLRGQRVADLVTESEEEVQSRLQTWLRSDQPTPMLLTWRRAAAPPLACRCSGALARVGPPALLLLQVQPRTIANAPFTVLNRKIEELHDEIRARQGVEAELRHLNAVLEQEVARRTRELFEANEALQRRNEELQEFAYVASHDLQEPLRKITTFSELLTTEHAERLDEQGAFYLRRVHDTAGRMARLVRDLLVFSRVTSESGSLARVDLNDVFSEVLDDLSVRTAETRGRIDAGTLPTVLADATRMHQLFQNLVGNALKFHRAGVAPHVVVSAEAAEGPQGEPGWHIEVRDNGIGFDERYLDRIFNPFQRLHGRSEYEGTGIGLAICRRIAEKHGGTLNAHSEVGTGSRFVVWLPAPSQAGEHAARRVA